VSGEDGLQALYVASKIVESGIEGRAIYLDEEG
jgi:hypothetical protein